VLTPAKEVWSPLAYGPRSSLPAHVLDWLAARLAHLLPPRPPGQGGTRPLSLEVRLDAVAAVILDGLSYRRAARMVGISKTEVGDSLDLLLGPLGDLGFYQPDGTFITSLDELRHWLGEMAQAGEAVCLDGLATRVQRPRGWANQKVLYDPSATPTSPRALPSRPSTAICSGSTVAGREAAMSTSSSSWQGWEGCWTRSRSQACWIGGSAAGQAAPALARPGRGAPHQDRLSDAQRAFNRLQQGCARWLSRRSPHLANAWALRRRRGLLYRLRGVYRAAGALICLGRWLHRVPT
jgi:hypothetical protein